MLKAVVYACCAAVCAEMAAAGETPPACPGARDYQPQLRDTLIKTPWPGTVPPFADRAGWKKISEQAPAVTSKTLYAAGLALKTAYQAPADSLYLEFFENGNRTRYQDAYGKITTAARNLTHAYLLTADRRYLEKLEEVLNILLGMKSWMLPAHDHEHRTFDGKENHIELVSSLLSWQLGVTHCLLRNELRPETAAALKQQLYTRTLEPARQMIAGARRSDWWMHGRNNWNAVCWCGVLGTALAVEEDMEARIFFVNAALNHIGFSLLAFPADGYCSEGVGYWNYGFGHNLRFAALIRGATGGAIDLFQWEEMRRPAAYPEKITVVDGRCPAYADCDIGSRADLFNLGLRDYLQNRPTAAAREFFNQGSFCEQMLIAGLPPLTAPETAGIPPAPSTTVFDNAGVVILRPAAAGVRLCASFKGGSNHELHNHNDVGTFVVFVDGEPAALDAGAEVYTARTFGPRRYESNLLNSWGHSVPVIGGKLQTEGKNTDARLLAAEDTAERFRWLLDLAPAYQLPEIKKLEREFIYTRTAPGTLTVCDRAEFARPLTFAAAVITMGEFTPDSNGGVIVYNGQKLRFTVAASAPWRIVPEEIKENTKHGKKITRLGINLTEEEAAAELRLTFTPGE